LGLSGFGAFLYLHVVVLKKKPRANISADMFEIINEANTCPPLVSRISEFSYQALERGGG
jgi:hypothetical protein